MGLTDEGLDRLGSHEFHKRQLATNGGEDSSVTLATTTKKTTKCKVTVEGKEDAANLLGDKYNESNYDSFGQNDTIAFHAEPAPNAEVPADQDEPQAQIGTPDVQIMNGTIAWPELDECVALDDVVGYEKGIPMRNELDATMDNAKEDTAGANVTRRLSSHESADDQIHPLLLKVRIASHQLEMMHRDVHEVKREMPREMDRAERKLWRKYIRRTAFKLRIKARNYVVNKLGAYLLEQGKAKVEEEICDATGLKCPDGVVRDSGYILYNEPPSAECKSAKKETIRLVDHYDFYVVDTMEAVDTYGNNVIEYTDKAYQTETKLFKMDKVITLIRPVALACGFLPVVGPAFAVFARALGIAQRVIKRTHKGMKKFNDQLRKFKIQERAQLVVDKNEEMAGYMHETVYTHEKYLIGTIIVADTVCSSTATKTACNGVTTVFKPVNDFLDRIYNVYVNLKMALLSIRRPLFEIYKLSINAIWLAITGFFDLIYNLLRPFINLLEFKICVWVPIPVMRYYVACTVSCVTACKQRSRSRLR